MSFGETPEAHRLARGLSRGAVEPLNQMARTPGNGRVELRGRLRDALLATNERNCCGQWFSIAGFVQGGPSSLGAGRATGAEPLTGLPASGS